MQQHRYSGRAGRKARREARGTVREPALDQVRQDMPKGAKGKAPASFSATVPVDFHVVTDGRTGT